MNLKKHKNDLMLRIYTRICEGSVICETIEGLNQTEM